MKAIKILFTGLMIAISCSLFAQPHVPDQHGSTEDQTPGGGGGAPVGSGIALLLTAAGAYGLKRWKQTKDTK